MFELLFSQYKDYQPHDIVLEIVAVLFGLASVFCAKKNNILVYPTGLVNTIIFVYLLCKWNLIGDMLINIYYSTMSIYGWYLWSKSKDGIAEVPISHTTSSEKRKSIIIFILTIVFVILIYHLFNKFNHWTAYVDAFTTGIFFVGMWLMAKRKIEHWYLWIIGDIISIPLYYYKGLVFTSLQFFIFTIIAYYGLQEWKTSLQKTTITT